MGSDWPHAEAVPQPRDFLHCLGKMSEADKRSIMRDNLASLLAA
jgi:hypothetical protein